MWRPGNPYLNDRLCLPDRTEISVSIGIEAKVPVPIETEEIVSLVSSPTLKPKSTPVIGSLQAVGDGFVLGRVIT
jgi:hypothetical protein